MEINNDIDDKIKTFIKIEYADLKKDTIYEIDESKKLINLYNPEKNIQFDNSLFFEFDKIFTNNDSNSDIYEEICLNCIKKSFEGNSFSFISFGETISNKFELLYGKIKDDYINQNDYGLFINLLNNIIKENKNFNIKISYLMVYEDNLIDLSLYNNEILDNIKVDDFLKNSFKIKNDLKIIDNIKKVPFKNDINEVIAFLNNIRKILLKKEENRANDLYSMSHLCSIIYITDKKDKIISNISFIILNGCEHLYYLDNKKTNRNYNKNDILDNSPRDKKYFELIKNSIGIQFTYDNIISCINDNKYINDIIINKNNISNNNNLLENNKKLNNEKTLKDLDNNNETKMLSKLSIVLYNICLGKNISNIKFRIIGNIKPISGFFKTTRDTLLFVTNCSKKYKGIKKSKNNPLIDEKVNIFDLNYQINLQMKQIENLNKIILKKEEKIDMLSKTYNKQINILKKCFDFKGDINILLSGDINTDEALFVQNIKNSNLIIKRQEGEIKLLKKKLENSNKEIIKYKDLSKIIKNDETMINYYLSVQNSKDNKNDFDEDNKILINELNKEIINLKKIIAKKDKIIEGLKKDLNIKNNILCNLPKSISNNYNNINKKSNKPEINSKTDVRDNNTLIKNEVKKLIKINEQKNNDILKSKYDLIIYEKKKQIYNLEHKLEGIEENYKNNIKMLNKEIVRLYEIFLYIITHYQYIFCNEEFFNSSNIKNIRKKKETFDEIILNIEKDINYFNFSCLHKELERQKKTKESIINNIHFEEKDEYVKEESKEIINDNNLNEDINKMTENEKIIVEKDNMISKLNNKILKIAHCLDEQIKINSNNNMIINSQKRTIDKINKDVFIYNNFLKNKIKNRNSYYNTPLTVYQNKLKKNNANYKNLSSIESSQRKNRVINEYNSFISFHQNNESHNYILNMSKIFNRNDSTNNGSFQQLSTRSNNKELRASSSNTLNTKNTNANTNNTKILNSQRKVLYLKKNRRPFSSYRNRNLLNK